MVEFGTVGFTEGSPGRGFLLYVSGGDFESELTVHLHCVSRPFQRVRVEDASRGREFRILLEAFEEKFALVSWRT